MFNLKLGYFKQAKFCVVEQGVENSVDNLATGMFGVTAVGVYGGN